MCETMLVTVCECIRRSCRWCQNIQSFGSIFYIWVNMNKTSLQTSITSLPPRNLRCQDRNLLTPSCTHTVLAESAFSHSSPAMWNTLFSVTSLCTKLLSNLVLNPLFPSGLWYLTSYVNASECDHSETALHILTDWMIELCRGWPRVAMYC